MSTDAANHGERKTSGSPDLDRCHVIYGPGAVRQTDYLVPYTSSYEIWTVRDSAGGVVELAFDYTGGLPARSKSESKVYSAVEPTFFRIYRVEQGADVVKSVPANIDRVQNFKLTIGIQELRKIFDGSQKGVAVTMIPWYIRQVSVP